MRAEDIVRQLAFSLPQRTGRFSDEVSIAAISHTGSGTISVTTGSDHGLMARFGIPHLGLRFLRFQ